jgi:hypothetical protein
MCSAQTITCDVECRFSFFLRASSKIGNCLEERNYVLAVDKLRGRLNSAVLARERLIFTKLDGWPEVGSTYNI